MLRTTDRQVVALIVVLSLGMTAFTVWSVYEQSLLIEDRTRTDLLIQARREASSVTARLRGDVERTLRIAEQVLSIAGETGLDNWIRGQEDWALAVVRDESDPPRFFPITPMDPAYKPRAVRSEPDLTVEEPRAALPRFEEMAGDPDPFTRGRGLLGAAECHHKLAALPKAADCYARAAEVFESTPNLQRFAFEPKVELIGVQIELSQFDAARELLRELVGQIEQGSAAAYSVAEIDHLSAKAKAVLEAPGGEELTGQLEFVRSRGDDLRAALPSVAAALDSACGQLRQEAARDKPPETAFRTARKTDEKGLSGPRYLVATRAIHMSPLSAPLVFMTGAADGPGEIPDQPEDPGESADPDVAASNLSDDTRAELVICLALATPVQNLITNYWPSPDPHPTREPRWRIAFPGEFRESDKLCDLEQPFGPAVLVVGPEAQAEFRSDRRQRLAYVAATAAGTGVAWAAVIWLMLRAIAYQRELVRLQRRFVADVSHELKTPLAMIRLLAETLLDGRVRDPDRVQGYYTTITREAERLSLLLETILDFSRLESGRKQYDFRDCDVVGVARQAWTLFEPQLADAGFERTFDIGPDIPTIRADPAAIQQIIVNLLQNAFRYSGDGRYIRLALAREGYTITISVEDHGIGMTRSQLQRLGQTFFRAEDSRVRQTRGSGLGLAIVNRIVQAHGGKLDVQSRPGKGSTFTVWIPFEPPVPKHSRRRAQAPVDNTATGENARVAPPA